MSGQRSPSRALAEVIRDWLPAQQRASEEVNRETVQTIVWIVALATGLLSLAALSDQLLARLEPRHAQVMIGLLVSSIMFGVLQRILHHWLDQHVRRHLFQLQARLAGATADLESPPSPDLLNTRDEIVRALKSHFDLDYSFLISHDVPLAGCQKAYEAQFRIWSDHEVKAQEALGATLAAFSGKPAVWGSAMFGPNREEFDGIRQRARRLTTLGWGAFVLFGLSTLSFLAALILLAIGLTAVA